MGRSTKDAYVSGEKTRCLVIKVPCTFWFYSFRRPLYLLYTKEKNWNLMFGLVRFGLGLVNWWPTCTSCRSSIGMQNVITNTMNHIKRDLSALSMSRGLLMNGGNSRYEITLVIIVYIKKFVTFGRTHFLKALCLLESFSMRIKQNCRALEQKRDIQC